MPRTYKTPLFQHRHYEWLANRLGKTLATVNLNPEQRKHLTTCTIADLKATNPQFQPERFRAAVQAAYDAETRAEASYRSRVASEAFSGSES